jgi:hypothetical protein
VLIDEIYIGSDSVCHVVGPAPPTPTPTATPNVVSVTFSQVTASTEPISPNPVVAPYNPGIGQRIFPDDDTPGDTVDRRLVRVTATLSQPIANVPVYFRNFDLDDPTTDSVIDPNGAAGNDNNGMPRPGQLLFANGCGANGPSVFCPTNASGVATIDFVVTRQPGDNFAIAASVDPIAVNRVTVNGIELADGNGQNLPTETCPTQPICRSQMLTVWRRLHIEVDSMGQSTENRAIGTIRDTTRIRAGETVDVPLNPTTPSALEPNRFEGGRLVVNFRSYRVTCVIANGDTCNTADSVRVTNTAGVATLFAGYPFELYDDDDFNDNDVTFLDGDTGEDISAPDEITPNGMSLLTVGSDVETSNVFAPAYVRPLYLDETRDNCLFQQNLASDDDRAERRAIFRQCWDFGDRNTDEEFWYVVVFGAYQFTQASDLDPTTEYESGVVGIVDATTGVTGDLEGSGALIFMELHRTREIPAYNPDPMNVTSLSNTVAHEVGHLFSCQHGEYGLMGDPDGNPTSSLFTPASISRIRVLIHP